jgi:phosphate transport system substrate-binding protein
MEHPAALTAPTLAKCPGGIRGLNEITNRGFPHGLPTLICGGAARLAALLLAVLVLASGFLRPATAASLVVQGSNTFSYNIMVPYQADVEQASRQSLNVLANKSDVGLRALLQGRADLAMLSTPLAEEIKLLRQTDPNLPLDQLQAFYIGSVRATLIVHPTNTVRAISLDNLRRVLLGETANWRSLGGADMPIRLVVTRQGGGALTTVEVAALGSGRHITVRDQIRVDNGPQVVTVVEQEIGALGISQRLVTDGRAVGELATPEPIVQQLSLVSLGDPTPAMQAVIAACRALAMKLDP